MTHQKEKIYKITEALIEARRFTKCAKAWEQRIIDEPMSVYGSKESAACKRASMDLSRVLTELRKS